MTRSLKNYKYVNLNDYYKYYVNKYNNVNDLFKLKTEAIKKNWFNNKNIFVVFDKKSTILEFMVGFYLLVYTGNSYTLIFVRENMVGYKIGEFVLTKKLGHQIHDLKRKKGKKK